MDKDLIFISMEGRKGFKIGDFLVRDDIALPVYIPDGKSFSEKHITPQNIIGGMIKVLIEDENNENIDYYRDFIFSVEPNIEANLSFGAYEAEKQKNFKDAIDIYRVLLNLNPNSIDNILNIAVCYDEYSQHLYSTGNEMEASKMEDISKEFFDILEANSDKRDSSYYYLGRFYLYRENYEKAIEYLENFVMITKDEKHKKEVMDILKELNSSGMADSDYEMARDLIESEKYKESLEFISKYIEKYPNSWHGFYLMGYSYRLLDEYNKAIEFLEKALQFNDSSSDIYNELGLCFMNLKNFAKSELNFEKALRNKPDDVIIISNLAVMFFKKGDKNSAVKCCDVGLELNSEDQYIKDLRKTILEEM